MYGLVGFFFENCTDCTDFFRKLYGLYGLNGFLLKMYGFCTDFFKKRLGHPAYGTVRRPNQTNIRQGSIFFA